MQLRVWEQLDPKKPEEMKRVFESLGLSVQIEATAYGTISECIVTGRNGVQLRINNAPSIHRRKPPTVKKYVLSGNVLGITISEQFDTFEDGYTRKRLLEEKSDAADLKLEEKEVEVSEPTAVA